jgi:hypothetical protein
MHRQLLIFAVILFYCALVAAAVVITPARIAQMFYDVGQKIREHPLGWLLLALFIRLFTLYTYAHTLSLFFSYRNCIFSSHDWTHFDA